jgi:hypothetical protein
MNAEIITALRAESLAATLQAARRRRVRRRAVAMTGGMLGLCAIALAFLPLRERPRTFSSISGPALSAAAAPSPKRESSALIHTHPRSVVRIATTRKISDFRVTTLPSAAVERIGRDDLRAWFPERGIAFIQTEGGPPAFLIF